MESLTYINPASQVWWFSCSVLSESATPWTIDHQASLSLEFPRQEYRSGVAISFSRFGPNSGIEPGFPALQEVSCICRRILYRLIAPSSTADARDMGSIPGWGRSTGVGNDNPLQYSWLENTRATTGHAHTHLLAQYFPRTEEVYVEIRFPALKLISINMTFLHENNVENC